MKNVLVAVVLLITTTALAEPPATDPFGFTQGMTLAELKKLGPVEQGPKPYLFRMTTAPKPFAGFERYLLTITPRTGLCRVTGIGSNIKTTGYGLAVKSAFETLASALDDRYGPSGKMDRLLEGSFWKNASDWMMGIKRKERVLTAIWAPQFGSTLPRDVREMTLYTGATDEDTGYVRLTVAYRNLDDCREQFTGSPDRE